MEEFESERDEIRNTCGKSIERKRKPMKPTSDEILQIRNKKIEMKIKNRIFFLNDNPTFFDNERRDIFSIHRHETAIG